jgi:hypothetical protein
MFGMEDEHGDVSGSPRRIWIRKILGHMIDDAAASNLSKRLCTVHMGSFKSVWDRIIGKIMLLASGCSDWNALR